MLLHTGVDLLFIIYCINYIDVVDKFYLIPASFSVCVGNLRRT